MIEGPTTFTDVTNPIAELSANIDCLTIPNVPYDFQSSVGLQYVAYCALQRNSKQ